MSQSVIDAIIRLGKADGQYYFYNKFLLQMNRVYTKKVPTLGVSITNKINLYINTDFFDNLTDKAQEEVLMHECEHLIRDHIGRSIQYNTDSDKPDLAIHQRFNVAADICINEALPTLNQDEVTLRDGEKFSGCTFNKFKQYIPDLERGRSSEYYYSMIQNLEEKIKQQLGLDGLSQEEIEQKIKEMFDTIDDHSTWKESINVPGVVLNNVLKNALKSAAKGAGNVPEHVQQLIKKLSEATVNWKEQLNRFKCHLERFIKEKTRKKRNRRYGIMFPGKVKKPKLKIVIGVDTSGSVSDTAIAQFFSEIDKIYAHTAEIYVIQCDAEIQSVEKYSPKSEIKVTGRGGTLYQPVLDKTKELEADGLIYFGDGDCFEDNLQKPQIPVLWAMIEGCRPPVEWGMKCEVKVNNE